MRSSQLHQFAEEVRQKALEMHVPAARGSTPQAAAAAAAVSADSSQPTHRSSLPGAAASPQQPPEDSPGVRPADEEGMVPIAATKVARPVVEASFLDLNADLGMEVSEEETSEDYSEDSD